ncbi:substrate-binding domain-containing protein [Phycisphaerales bacterium AB-hyl4]|uniref:Substrate-binding domain-containing protein n=1 Tax=Natronomicrosphaera hydrolytica TaxID=3242702 RepID=A0ABV4U5I6_9BACT
MADSLQDSTASLIRKLVLERLDMEHPSPLPIASEIAARAGVSLMTVRQAMARMAAAGLIERRQGSGTYVAPAVLRGRKSIALVWGMSMASHDQAWFPLLFAWIQQAAKARGWSIRRYSVLGSDDEPDHNLERLLADAWSLKYRGLIYLPIPSVSAALEASGLRAVSDIKMLAICADLGRDSIVIDQFGFGEAAAERLIQQGARRLAFIGGRDGQASRAADYSGFRHALHNHPEARTEDAWARTALLRDPVRVGYEAFTSIWAQPDKPDGLVVADDVVMYGVMLAMLEHGVKVPKDLRVVALGTQGARYDGYPIEPPRITFSPRTFAFQAVDALIRMIQDDLDHTPVIKVSPDPVAADVDASTGQESQHKRTQSRSNALPQDIQPRHPVMFQALAQRVRTPDLGPVLTH